jgi:hypothetical protein
MHTLETTTTHQTSSDSKSQHGTKAIQDSASRAFVSSTNLAGQEDGSVEARLVRVQKVSREDEQRPIADGVGHLAVNLRPGRRVVGDSEQVLEVLGVAKEHGALDLLLDGGAEARHGGGNHGGSLAVASGDNGSVGALGVGQVKQADRLVDGSLAGAVGQEVARHVGRVRATDALDPNVVPAVSLFQLLSQHRASRASHVANFPRGSGKDQDDAGAVGAVAVLELITDSRELTNDNVVLCGSGRSRESDGVTCHKGKNGEELHLE